MARCEKRHTIEQGVEDELAVFFNQVIDVTEDATIPSQLFKVLV